MPIPYTDEQLDSIASLAEDIGLANVLLPARDVEDNPLMNLEIAENRLVLHFKYMTVTVGHEPWEDMAAGEFHVKLVALANGAEGEWINGPDFLPRNRFFRFSQNGLYVFLRDERHLPEETVQAVAESFVPLEELRR